MKARTIEELRARAKQLGLAGYSKLRKDELLKRIAACERTVPAAVARQTNTKTPRTTTGQKDKLHTKRTKQKSVSTSPVRPSRTESAARTTANPEQLVESAKFAFAPPGVHLPEPAYPADLGEDIDPLPALHEPLLCLLPQKPGVLHAYWILPPGALSAQALRLRLARLAGDGTAILEERILTSERGHWYFHVEEGADTDSVYLQLGSYRPDGQFVSAFERGIARIPSLYASARTDRQWWVSDAQFRDMYRRAGGVVRATQLGWAGSPSSPGEQPGWPGNISSQR